MSSQFGPRTGAGAVSTGIARDPAQLVPIHLNINYDNELGTDDDFEKITRIIHL